MPKGNNPVPEEDLSLHEDFAPIIAENGLIRQKETPKTQQDDPLATRMDVVQDLVALRSHAKKEAPPPMPDMEEFSTKSHRKFWGRRKKKKAKKTTPSFAAPAANAQPDPASGPQLTLPAGSAAQTEAAAPQDVLQPDRGMQPTQTPAEISPLQSQSSLPGEAVPTADSVTSFAQTADSAQPPAQEQTSMELPTNLRDLSDTFALQSSAAQAAAPNGVAQPDKTPHSTPPAVYESEGLITARVPIPFTAAPAAAAQPAKQEKRPKPGLPPKPTKPKPAAVQQQPPQRVRRWPWVVLVLVLGLLAVVGGLVPVEKIPLLRNLAYAMGFDKQDTARMSFLRALLTWTDETVGLPGRWERPSIAGSGNIADGGIFTLDDPDRGSFMARMERSGGKTQLIDMQALHALQRKEGHSLDTISGTSLAAPGQEDTQGRAEIRDGQVLAQTEANRTQGDVYFGSEAYAVNRHFQDGYDSTKTLAEVKNPHISDGVPIDWLKNMTQRMMRADTGLAGLNKELDSTKVNWRMGLADLGDGKANKDLYHAWITSRMSKYTSNIMLKKSLADSSFLGADIPTTATNVLSFSGVQVDAESLAQDQQDWKEYLEFEKTCREELTSEGRAGYKVMKAEEDMSKMLERESPSNWGVPATCLDMYKQGNFVAPSSFVKKVGEVQTICTTLETGYAALGEACRMQYYPNEIKCDKITSDYNARWTEYYAGCKTFHDSKKAAWEAQYRAEHPGQNPPDYDKTQWLNDGKEKTEESFLGNETKDSLQKDNAQFATLLRATCDNAQNCTAKYNGDVSKVQETIDQGTYKL